MNLKHLPFVFLGFLLIISTSFSAVEKSFATTYVDVTVLQAKTMVDTNSSLVVLDVRNESEYVTGHIRNAKLIPLSELNLRLNELKMSDDILVYCVMGGRSATASQILTSNGFLHVYNMLGGMTDWVREEYPTYIKYPSIQAAIDNAAEGDKIYVSTGLYAEHLSVNKPISIIGENRDTTTIDGTGNGTILYVNADNVSISDFKIQYSGCACTGYCGVNVESFHQNINITNNLLISNGFGIQLDNAKKVIITNNNITYNTDSSIIVRDSTEITVNENNVANNFDGIEVENSTQSTTSRNIIFNSVNGISISDSSNNVFSGNTVSSNRIYGFYINQSNDNSMLHNNLLENGRHVSIRNSTNFWDDGFEGNFWSNYTGADTDLDGIGETPHIIDSNNRDNHPLMGASSVFHTSLNRDVSIVSNSTVDDFEYADPSTIRLRVSNTTANQTIGFCRIIIPHSLIDPQNGSFSVVIDNGQTPVLFLNNTLYDNETHRWIYFTYPHSTHQIVIIPEFPLSLVQPLVMVATTTVLATALYMRKRIRKR